ncbi:hypothetical protein RHGRI_016055 [Rhododendron griersonianum]|uniref:NmrA-like domain-containing protein n=1 Tax=Rhododendron griersonianum TaxID=479676 RepID=A0AAV6JST1_9ERIC|nr:hypothetical protein RHGRI_016055 [Rhododendron griersonianum]
MAEKSKILIIGGTGYIGKFIVEASVQSSHRTFTLGRESTVSDPAKAKLIDSFKNSGVTLLHVCSSEFSSTVYPEAPILSDDPTPTPSSSSLPEPSCFGSAPNEPLILPSSPPTELPAPPLSEDSPPHRSTRGDLNDHENLVKAIKKVDVVISTVAQMQILDQVKIIAAIKEVGNIKCFVLDLTLGAASPDINYSVFVLAINHSVFVKGDRTNLEIEPSFGVEASELYPDVKYTTVLEYLDQFV